MQRARLRSRELGHQQGQYWAAHDSGLDHRARVDADHRGTVKKRVVIVGLRVGLNGHAALRWPQRDAVEPAQVDLLPFRAALRMRPDQDLGVSQLWLL